MALQRYLNKGGLGGNHTIWWLLQAMIDAGWDMIMSSSGAGGVVAESSDDTGSIADQGGNTMRLTDTGQFANAKVGDFISISGSGSTNDGDFFKITARTDNYVEYTNAAGADESAGSLDWTLTGNVFDPTDNPKNGNAVSDLGTFGDDHFGNDHCWIVMRDPNGHEVLFARDANYGDNYDDEWFMSYSRAAGFALPASPDPDVPPSATDEQTVSSSGTKATPGAIHSIGTAATIVHAAADSTPSAGGFYGFFAVEMIATNEVKCHIMLDDLQNVASGDVDGATFTHDNAALDLSQLFNPGNAARRAMVDVGGAGEAWLGTSYMALVDYGSRYWSSMGGTSKYDGAERPMPIVVAEPTVGGYLGMSRWLNWAAVARDYPNTGDSFNVLYIDSVVVLDLWDGSTTPQAS